MQLHIPTIGPEEKFYGYITGIGISQNFEIEDGFASKMYVTFEYRNITTAYLVPDPELFSILSTHLISMALQRSISDSYGFQKLCISKHNDRWIVDLP
jgi:hypothetical protein